LKKEKVLEIWNARMLSLMDHAIRNEVVSSEKEWCEKIEYERTNLPKIKSGDASFRMQHCIKAATLTGASMDFICGLQEKMLRKNNSNSPVDLIREALRLLEVNASKNKTA